MSASGLLGSRIDASRAGMTTVKLMLVGLQAEFSVAQGARFGFQHHG